MIDGKGRTIDYLRLSITDLCNLRCRYCMPEEGIVKWDHTAILRYEEILSILKVIVPMGIKKIRITGGEPLIRKGILDLIRGIRAFETIEELVITTNGILLEPMAESLKKAGIDRVNVSLDTMIPEKYKVMTRGGDLGRVLKGIEKATQIGLTPIKLNTVLIGGFNDDEIDDFCQLTQESAMDVRFIELMPVGEVVQWNKERFISSEEVLRRVPSLVPEAKEDPSSPADYYRLPKAKGKVGIIRPISCKFCDACNRIRLTSDGKLKYCLHSNRELDLRQVIEEGRDMTQAIQSYINGKPEEHRLEQQQYLEKSMFRIGG